MPRQPNPRAARLSAAPARRPPEGKSPARPPEAKTPTRIRGKRTRAKLLEAAQQVFEQDGFINARVADIAAAAGVAHGSFYTYFDSKEDVFREVVGEAIQDLSAAFEVDAEESAVDRVRAAIRRYLELYERHAPILGLIEQVGVLTEFHELRRELRNQYVEQVERTISRLRADDESKALDAHILANALVGMIDNFAYTWFVLDEPFAQQAVLDTLDAIWLRSLGLADATTRPPDA